MTKLLSWKVSGRYGGFKKIILRKKTSVYSSDSSIRRVGGFGGFFAFHVYTKNQLIKNRCESIVAA